VLEVERLLEAAHVERLPAELGDELPTAFLAAASSPQNIITGLTA